MHAFDFKNMHLEKKMQQNKKKQKTEGTQK